MHEYSSGDDDGPVREAQSQSERQTVANRLRTVVVQYENKPDRCTITPANCTDEQRLTRWITADTSTFVDLDEYR